MEEAGDEPLFCERAAGIDIGKQVVSVTIRVPSDTRRAAGSRRPGSSAPPAASCWRWRTGCAAGKWSGPGWRRPATTCDVRVHEFKWEAPLEARLRPGV